MHKEYTHKFCRFQSRNLLSNRDDNELIDVDAILVAMLATSSAKVDTIYLFTHTTNRVDVALGSRLFNHLIGLPLAYFESRQVGQNVARVRELDTIRNFITGTALTLVIDLLFVFVFLAVMWTYSPTLTWIVLATVPFYIGLSVFK